jgi:hypothetical protein
METKHCNGCGGDKELSEFTFHKSGRSIGKPFSRCKTCANSATMNWNKKNKDKRRHYSQLWRKADPERARKVVRECNYRRGSKPASENKSCAAYLGVVIAETVLAHEFPGFKRMPNNNPDYDYECPKGFKIDAKSSCRRQSDHGNDSWRFNVNNNQVADYFLCIAFDNRKNLNPEHIWLIPGDVVNDKMSISITDSPKSLAKWSQYERPLENVLECCSKLRES